MAALPYIQLYVADYLADTIHLTAEEHGAYLLIIFNYWQTAKPIPDDRAQAITRIIDDEKWVKVRAKISPFFNIIDDLWTHERVEEDLEKVLSKSIKASRAGKKSAERRALKNKEIPTNVQHATQRTLNHKDKDKDKDKDIHKNKTLTSKPTNGVPYQKIIDLYHQYLPDNPRIASLSATRKSHIRARWKNGIQSVESWEKYFVKVSTSDFLTGKSNPGPGRKVFLANIDFLIKENNVLKIIEGNYHG